MKGLYKEAEEEYKKVLEIEPPNSEIIEEVKNKIERTRRLNGAVENSR